MALPIEITVVLFGLDGTGGFGVDVSAADLEAFLADALPEHCPTVGARGQRSRVCYDVQFRVQHAAAALEGLEHVMRTSMARSWVVGEGSG